MAGDAASASAGAASRVRTLADLARIAGVSAGTVSRALAGKTLVNVETRERIRELARIHGFRPNQMASKLRTQRTGVIGIVVPLGHERGRHISDPLLLTLLGHLADQLTESGFDIMLSRAIPDGTGEWLERITGSGMVDGVLVIGQSNQFDVIEAVSKHYLPMVAWGAYHEGQTHCAVAIDNVAGGRIAAEHLIAAGARKLAFLGNIAGIEIDKRHQGAAAAAEAAGVPLVQVPINQASEEMEAQIRAAREVIGAQVDGIFAASDLIAMSALRCLHEIGRRVPEDVKVVGFDDLRMARYTLPPLTTVRQEIAVGAKAMVERLMLRIGGTECDSLLMTPQLIRRESTRSS